MRCSSLNTPRPVPPSFTRYPTLRSLLYHVRRHLLLSQVSPILMKPKSLKYINIYVYIWVYIWVYIGTYIGTHI